MASSHKPRSVLLVAPGLPPEQVGGVEQHVGGLARELKARGHRVELYGRSSSAELAPGTLESSDWDGIPVTRVVYRWQGVDRLRDMYHVPVLDQAFATFLATRRFDVAHVHHLTGLSVGILDVLDQAGIPTVHTLHDYWNLCPRGQMFHKQEELCELLEAPRCGGCLAETFPFLMPSRRPEGKVGFRGEEVATDTAAAASLHDAMRRQLEQPTLLLTPAERTRAVFERCGIPHNRIAVVRNGVDIGLRAVPRTPGERLRVGYLGTLLPSKGLHVLVDAFLRLPPARVELRIHGNAVPYHGDQGYLTRVFQQLPPGRHVHYGGPYRAQDLAQILGSIDVVAVPALWNEAFGLTPREARMAGRPVVVSAIGGLTEGMTEGETGFVVPPGDPEALAAALRKFLDQPALLDRLGQPRAGEVRGFAEMTEELVAVYERLPLGHGLPGPRVTTLWADDLDARAELYSRPDGSMGLQCFAWRDQRWQALPGQREVVAQDRELALRAARQELERVAAG